MDYDLFNKTGDWLQSKLRLVINDIKKNGMDEDKFNQCEEIKGRIRNWDRDYEKIMEIK